MTSPGMDATLADLERAVAAANAERADLRKRLVAALRACCAVRRIANDSHRSWCVARRGVDSECDCEQSHVVDLTTAVLADPANIADLAAADAEERG